MVGFDGRGASTDASSAVSERGIQSLKPERQHRLSGPTSPRSQASFTFSTESGPTCFSSMATYQSCEEAWGFASSLSGSSSASASLRTFSAVASRAAASPRASPVGILCVPELRTWSNTAPISSSSTSVKSPPSGGVPSVAGSEEDDDDSASLLGVLAPFEAEAGAEEVAGSDGESFPAAAPAGRTVMLWPHFLQRTLTPLGPTLSSLIMYCARQLSQTKRISSASLGNDGKNPVGIVEVPTGGVKDQCLDRPVAHQRVNPSQGSIVLSTNLHLHVCANSHTQVVKLLGRREDEQLLELVARRHPERAPRLPLDQPAHRLHLPGDEEART